MCTHMWPSWPLPSKTNKQTKKRGRGFAWDQGSAEYGSKTKSLLAVSVNKLFLRHSHVHSFMLSAMPAFTLQCQLLQQILFGTQNLILTGPLRKSLDLFYLYKMHWRDITKYKICDSLILDSKGKTVPKLKVIFGGKWEYPPKYWVYSQLDYILAIIHVNFLICDEGIMVM